MGRMGIFALNCRHYAVVDCTVLLFAEGGFYGDALPPTSMLLQLRRMFSLCTSTARKKEQNRLLKQHLNQLLNQLLQHPPVVMVEKRWKQSLERNVPRKMFLMQAWRYIWTEETVETLKDQSSYQMFSA